MRTFTVGVALLAGLGLGTARAEEPDQAIADLLDHHLHHQHGGITQFVALSLDTLGEDEARRPKVEQVEDALNDCMEPVEDGETKVLLAIADGVAAGAFDAAKVKGGVDQVLTASDAIHNCVAPLLNTLHKTLLPPERAELGDKVTAHWEVWRQLNHDADPAGREAGGRLAELGKKLSLPPAQLDAIAKALKGAFAGQTFDAGKVQKQVQAFGAAFVTASFDATSVTTKSTGYLTSHAAQRLALFYSTVTPLLTPPQRTALAADLRDLANHHPENAP